MEPATCAAPDDWCAMAAAIVRLMELISRSAVLVALVAATPC
jgi:hypothetical protein